MKEMVDTGEIGPVSNYGDASSGKSETTTQSGLIKSPVFYIYIFRNDIQNNSQLLQGN